MTEPQPTVWPSVSYDDAPAGLRFLVDVFGFREVFVVPDDNGDITHSQLRWPEGGGVMLGSVKHCAGSSTGVGATYVVTDKVDEIHQRCVAAGADITTALEDTDYGSHTFTVNDPECNVWTFGTYRGEPG